MTVLPLSLPDYVVPDGHFDEVRTGDGALRAAVGGIRRVAPS